MSLIVYVLTAQEVEYPHTQCYLLVARQVYIQLKYAKSTLSQSNLGAASLM